jgi:twitching motility protein PilT
MPRIDSFLRMVVDQSASDLHLRAGSVPVVRHDGDLVPLPFRSLSAEEAERLLLEVLDARQQQALQDERQVDFMYVLETGSRFRVNAFHHSRGLGACFRVIPARVPTLDELEMPPVVRRFVDFGSGLVVITGPTGSGKTTTLAAMVDAINRTSARHVITIEDPIEFVHAPQRSQVTQREVGRHVASFAAGLRSALREAPDVLVIGELRDAETIQLALTAAETGILVLGTLHTNSAAKVVDRIVDAVPEESREHARGMLSVILKGVVAQHLCRRANGDGRVAALEVVVQCTAVSTMIRENKVHQLEGYVQSATGDGSGTQSLDAALARLVERGTISGDEALAVADHPQQLRKRLEAVTED